MFDIHFVIRFSASFHTLFPYHLPRLLSYLFSRLSSRSCFLPESSLLSRLFSLLYSLLSPISNIDDILNLKLDHIRNQLQGANLYIGVVTMCIGFAGVLLSGYVIYEDASLRNKIIVLGGTAFIMLAMIMCVMSNFARKGLLSTAV